MSRTDLATLGPVVAVVLALGVGISALVAVDDETWTRDERGCYLHVLKDKRVWWSDTPSHTTRRTYCPEADQ